MAIDLAALADEMETLQRIVQTLAAERTNLAEAQAEIERLRLIIRKLQRHQFGRRAEPLNDDQLLFGFEDSTPTSPASKRLVSAKQDPRDNANRPIDQVCRHLAREDLRLELERETCPCCGGELHLIGETVSEMLDHVPARLRSSASCRPRYGCRVCGSIHQAAAPERPIGKGLATPGLLAHVLVAKYCDHLPLYHCTGRAKFSPGMVLSSTERPSPTGLAEPFGGGSPAGQACRECLRFGEAIC